MLGFNKGFGWISRSNLSGRHKIPPFLTSLIQWLIGNTGTSSIDKVEEVPDRSSTNTPCVVISTQTIIAMDLEEDDVVTHQGSAMIVDTTTTGIHLGVGTLGMISINGGIVYPCQEKGGYVLESVNSNYPNAQLDDSKCSYSTSNGIENWNDWNGTTLVERAIVAQPFINPTTFKCELSYAAFDGEIDWGDGSAIEPLPTTAIAKYSHTYPDADESKYTMRITGTIFSQVVVTPSDPRKIFNGGGLLGNYNHSSNKTSSELTHFSVGAFDKDVTVNLSNFFKNKNSLTYIDFSAPNKLKVNNLNSCFVNNDIEYIDLTNLDVSNCSYMASAFLSCISLKDVDVTGWDIGMVFSFTSFLSQVTLNTDNYSKMLVEFAKTGREYTVYFSGGFSKYAGQEAIDARQSLEDRGWVITDGGLE